MATANRTFRSSMLLSTAAAALFAVPGVAHAQLVNSGDLVDSVDSDGNGGRLTVVDTSPVQTDMTVLSRVVVANWNRFNVTTGTTLNVNNGTANPTATLVNRVIGANLSDISGTINATDVNLWLINQNGIVFGDGAAINSASFFASTLDVTNQDLFDFYEGTDLAGNGASKLNFAGSLGNTVTTSSPNVRFKTDGSLMFVSEQLDLDAEFDAGTGRVSFVTAADVDVTFTPGSPLTFVVGAGTTVAQGQAISGTVTGGGADFAMFTASGVVDAVLRVDASVTATTAVPTDNGVRLIAGQDGTGTVTVELDGGITSTGTVDFTTDGAITATQSITGSSVAVTAGTGIALDDITATAGTVSFSTEDGDLTAGDVSATGDITIDATINTDATFASLVSSGGRVGNVPSPGPIPNSITVTGLTSGTSVDLTARGALNFGNVTSTVGDVALTSLAGSLAVGDITSAGLLTLNVSDFIAAGTLVADGNVSLDGGFNITTTAITSDSGDISVTSFFGALNLGNLDAAGAIAIDTIGSLTAGTIMAGGALTIGGVDRPNGVTINGGVTAQSIAINSDDALLAQNMTATGGGIALDVSFAGGIVAGNLQATGDITFETSSTTGAIFASLVSTGGSVSSVGATPANITVTGLTQGTSVFLTAQNSLNLGNVVATLGGVLLNTDTGAITVGNVSATSTIELGAGAGISAGTIATTDGDVILTAANGITAGSISTLAGLIDAESSGGGALNLGTLSATADIRLDTAGTLTTGAITAGGALLIGSAILPSTVTINGNAVAASVNIRSVSGIVAQDIEATNGAVLLSGSDVGFVGGITAGNVRATGNLTFEAGNNSRSEFASLTSTGGTVSVLGTLPGVLAVTGEVRGAAVSLFSVNEMRLADVTSTNGGITLNGFRGNIIARNLSATGGNVLVRTATLGSIAPANEFVTLGNVTAVGGNVTIIAPGAVTTGAIDARQRAGAGGAIDIDSTAGGALTLGDLTADGSIALDTTGSITGVGALARVGAVTIGAARVPLGVVSFSGSLQGDSVLVRTQSAFSVGNVTARAGNIDISTASIAALVMTASGDIDLVATGAINSVRLTAAGTVDVDSTGGGNLNLGDVAGDLGVTLDTSGTITAGAVRSDDGAIAVGLGSVVSSVTFTDTAKAQSIDIRTTGAFNGVGLSTTVGGIAVNAGTITATELRSAAGIDLDAVGAIDTTLLSAAGAIDVDSSGGGNLDLGDILGGLDVTLDTDGTITAGTVRSAGGALEVGLGSAVSSVTFTDTAKAQSIDIRTTGAFSGVALSATVGDITIDAGTITATELRAGGLIDLDAVGGIETTLLSAVGTIDVDSSGAGDLDLGTISAGLGITLDTDGSITTGSLESTGGAIEVGLGSAVSGVTFGDRARAQSITVRTTGAFTGTALTARAGDIVIAADTITATALSATGGRIDLDAVGAITTTSLGATDTIDVDSTAGNLNLGTISAGLGITLDTDGTITAGRVTSIGGALEVGLDSSADSVTFGDRAQAQRITIRTTGAFTGTTLTAAAGDLVINAGSITSGALRATGGIVDLDATGDVRTGSINATGLIDVDSTGGGLALGALDAGAGITLDAIGAITTGAIIARGGALDVGLGSAPQSVTFGGNATALSISVLAGDFFNAQNLTATAGSVTADAGTITAGVISATGGDVDLAAFEDITTAAITATGAITVESNAADGDLRLGELRAGRGVMLGAGGNITTGAITAVDGITVISDGLGGDLALGNLRAGLDIRLDADGDIGTGTLTSTGGALRVGLQSSADSVTFGGNATARSISVLTSGAFTGANLAATMGDITIDAGSIAAGSLSATAGDIDLSAAGNIRTGANFASGFIDIDSVAGGLALGDLTAGLDIMLDADLAIVTGAIVSTSGALTVGLGSSVDSVTFGDDVSAVFVDVRSTGEILAGERNAAGMLLRRTAITATGSDLRLSGGAVTTGQLTSQANNVSVTAVGDIDVFGITARALIDVQSTGPLGDVTLGNLSAGTDVLLDADGFIRTGAVQAGRALVVGERGSTDGVTFGGNVTVRSMQVRSTGEVLAGQRDSNGALLRRFAITSTGGDAIILSDRITTGTVTATGGNVILRGTGDIDTGALTATRVGMQGGRVEGRTTTGNLNLGAITADREVDLDAGETATVAAIAARDGLVTVDARNIVITGATSATGGDVRLTAARNITTGAITSAENNGSGGAIEVVSTGAGTAAGTITLGILDAARLVNVTGNGAIDTRAITARRGSITLNGARIDASGPLVATGGDVRLTAVGNIVTGAITANRASNSGGSIDIESTGTGTAAGMLDLGQLIAAVGIELDARGAIATRSLTASNGAIDIDGRTITISGTAAATNGDVRLLAVDGITTDAITTNRAIDIDSTNGGTLNLGALDAGRGITLDTLGAITAQAIRAVNNLDIGATRLGTTVNLNGSVQAANITVNASGLVTANALSAVPAAGTITITSANIELLGDVTASRVTLRSRNNGTIGLGSASGTMSLTDGELDRIITPELLIDAGTGNIGIAGVSLRDAAGRNRVDIATTGAITITGDFGGAGNGTATERRFRLGGTAEGANVASRITADIDRATLDFGTGTLDLRGDRIVFGQQALIDRVIGTRVLGTGTGEPLTLDQIVKEQIGNAGSLLYTPLNLGAKRLDNPTYLTVARMTLTYGGSALFQNSAPRSGGNAFDGVKLGGTGAAGLAPLDLNPLVRPNVQNFNVVEGNVFALFGTINGASGPAAALGGEALISTDGQIPVLIPASRVNGCIIGSAEGCVTTIVGNFILSVPREVVSPIVAEPGDEVPFDPLVGSNNESLFSDAATPSKKDEECKQRDAAGVCVTN